MWNWNTPFQIPGNTSLFKPLSEPCLCRLNGILAPRPLHWHFIDILFQPILQQREFQKQVLCIMNLRSWFTDLLAIDKDEKPIGVSLITTLCKFNATATMWKKFVPRNPYLLTNYFKTRTRKHLYIIWPLTKSAQKFCFPSS